MNKCLALIGLIFIVAALGAGVVSLATTRWSEKADENSHWGIFYKCSDLPDLPDVTSCISTLESKSRRDVAFENEWYIIILACHSGGTFLALIASVLWLTTFCHSGAGLRVTSILLAVIVTGCYIASVIVWKYKYEPDDYKEGWSFWAAVGAAGAAGFASVLMLFAAIAHGRSKG